MHCDVLGTINSPQFGLHRSQPYNNIATLNHEPRLMPFVDQAYADSETIRRDYRPTHPAGTGSQSACSPSEYFCLERGRSDGVMDNRTARPATSVNGNSLNNSAMPEPKVDNMQSFQRSADEAMEVNSNTSHGSRRSGIPVSGTSP